MQHLSHHPHRGKANSKSQYRNYKLNEKQIPNLNIEIPNNLKAKLQITMFKLQTKVKRQITNHNIEIYKFDQTQKSCRRFHFRIFDI